MRNLCISGREEVCRLTRTAVCFSFALLFALASMGVCAQEVVIFKNQRAEVVAGHRVDGAWTYLIVREGEVGVLSNQIELIRAATADEIATSKPAEVQPQRSDAEQSRPASPCLAGSEQAKQPTHRLKDLSAKKIGDRAPGETGPGKPRSQTAKFSQGVKRIR